MESSLEDPKASQLTHSYLLLSRLDMVFSCRTIELALASQLALELPDRVFFKSSFIENKNKCIKNLLGFLSDFYASSYKGFSVI